MAIRSSVWPILTVTRARTHALQAWRVPRSMDEKRGFGEGHCGRGFREGQETGLNGEGQPQHERA
jgi:hypothetical protein